MNPERTNPVKTLRLPLDPELVKTLRAGQEVLLSGPLYVARDQAHARIAALLSAGVPPPFPLEGASIYYMGPSPTPEGAVIGSAGPTTAGRMDRFTPLLLSKGLRLMIGKGPRSAEVREAVMRYGAVYCYAYGGCGALYASRIVSSRPVAFEDLGPEAVLLLEVRDFPAVVALDSTGGSVFAPANTIG